MEQFRLQQQTWRQLPQNNGTRYTNSERRAIYWDLIRHLRGENDTLRALRSGADALTDWETARLQAEMELSGALGSRSATDLIDLRIESNLRWIAHYRQSIREVSDVSFR